MFESYPVIQRLPSGPVTIPPGLASGEKGYSVIWPLGVIFPTKVRPRPSPPSFVNHTLPSDPTVIPCKLVTPAPMFPALGTVYSWTTPLVVNSPILHVPSFGSSVHQSVPSLAVVIRSGS